MRIVCLGDSLTSGYSQGEDRYPYGAILQKLLDKEVGKGKHEVITCGNNGETAVSMARRYAVTTEIAERRRLPPKLFIIMAGTNDLLAYPVIEEDKIVNAISAMVDQTAVESAVAVVCTVPRMPSPEERSPDYALTKRRYRLNELIVEKFGADRVVDTASLDAFEEDGLHLTKRGYAELAKLIYPVCRAAMKRCRPSKKTQSSPVPAPTPKKEAAPPPKTTNPEATPAVKKLQAAYADPAPDTLKKTR
jgi:lysophospholipase L1-like esterase